jgi:hypothetical protein
MQMRILLTLEVAHGEAVDPCDVPEQVLQAVHQTINSSAWLYLPGVKSKPKTAIDIRVVNSQIS